MSTTISSRPGGLNRTLLLLLGVLSTAAGAGILTAATGLLGDAVPADQPVLTEPTLAYLSEQGWVPYAAAALGVVVALLALRWLLAQLPRRTGNGRVALGGNAGRGVTRLEAGTVSDAVEADVEGYAGVRSAHATLTGGRLEPTLTLSLVVDPSTDVRALQDRVRDHAATRLARALDADTVRRRLLVTMARGGSSLTVR